MVLLMESITPPRGAKSAKMSPLAVFTSSLWTLSPVGARPALAGRFLGGADASTEAEAAARQPAASTSNNSAEGKSREPRNEGSCTLFGARLAALASPLVGSPLVGVRSPRPAARGVGSLRRWTDVLRLLVILPLLACDAVLCLTLDTVETRRWAPKAVQFTVSALLCIWQMLAAELWCLFGPAP